MALKRLQRSRRLEPRDIVMMARAHYASNSGVIGRNQLIKLLSGPRATSQAALAFAELEGSNSAESERIYKFLQQAHKRDQKNFELLAKLTSLDLEAQKVKEASLRLNKAIQRSPKAAQIYLLRARVALSIGDFRSSRDDAERALRLSRSAHNEAIEILAYIYSQSPNPLATIESIEASAGPEGLSSNRLVLVARLYLKVGDEQKALATYERALAQGNDLTILKNDLAYLLAKVGKDYDRAIRLAREATRDPSEPLSAADTLGYVYLQSGEYDAALWQFRFVIATAEPPVAEYYYHMGLALLKLERLDEARTALERALVINPHFEEAADARTQLTVLPTDAGDAPGAS
jgi:tetratricopeptide (TPR) repeat protein